MEKIYEAIANLINNGTLFVYILFAFLIKEPLKKLLSYFGGWVAQGANADFIRRFLPPLEKKLDEKLSIFEGKIDARISKIELEMEKLSELLESEIRHSKKNREYSSKALESIIKDFFDKLEHYEKK